MSKSIREVMSELAALSERSVHARTKVREFLDENPVLGSLEIDESATALAGHVVFQDKPSEKLLCMLSAVRAADVDIGCFSGG